MIRGEERSVARLRSRGESFGGRSKPRLRRSSSGFTLVEIMIAMAIIGVVAVVLLDRRVKAVQDATKTKDQRLAWTLAAWKMSALELDDKLLMSQASTSDAGTFEDYAEDYVGYTWEYEAKREEVKVYDEREIVEKPREVWRVRLIVKRPEDPEPLVAIEGMFPIKEEPPPEAPK